MEAIQMNKINRSSKIGKVTIGLFAVLVCMMALECHALAAGVKTFSVSMDVEQDSAREMLTMINGFRTGDDAWYYDKDGNKVYVTKVGNLAYDYDLEQIAIQRAYEIAVSFDHTRPNGQSCFSCTYNGTRSWGENIAAGYSTAESVFIGWREDDCDYSGQGHRRNMLNTNFTSIGIGHVVYNGVHYWVQEFGYSNSNAAYTAPINEKDRAAMVDLDTDKATFYLVPEKTYVYETYTGQGSMPAVSGYYKTADTWTWGSKGLRVPDSEMSSVTWVTGDSAVVSVVGDGTYRAAGVGSTTLTGSAVYDGTTYSCTVQFTVSAKSIADSETIIVGSIADQTYTRSAITPVPKVRHGIMILKENRDYTVTYSNNTNVSTSTRSAVITLTGKGNYTGTRKINFTINPLDISDESLVAINGVSDKTYTGKTITQDGMEVVHNGAALVKGTDYTVTYSNNIVVSSETAPAVITLTGKGNYSGTRKTNFTINPYDISKANAVTVSGVVDKTYTGSAVSQDIKVVTNTGTVLVQNRDYTVEYSDNTNVGTKARMTITGKGNYTGSLNRTFGITALDITNCPDLTVSTIADQTYTRSAIKPTLTVKYKGTVLTEGTDYTLGYTNNTNVSTSGNPAVISITGKNDFKNTKTVNFIISALDFTRSGAVTLNSLAKQTYTGSAIEPEVLVKNSTGNTLVKGQDYKVTYSENVNAGTGKVRIDGQNNCAGYIETTFSIAAADFSKATVSGVEDKIYTGKGIKQDTLAVSFNGKKLVENTDYTVAYSDNMAVSTADKPAQITITGKGNFSGQKKESFVIKARALTGTVKITGSLKYGETLTVNVSGSNNSGDLKYQWKRGENTIAGATQTTYKLAKEDIGEIISCEVTGTVETGNITGTTGAAIEKAVAPAAPKGLTGTAASAKGKADGKISGVSTAMEYARKVDFSDKKACAGSEITGLAAGTYYIRFAETGTTKAGNAATVTITEAEPAPDPEPDPNPTPDPDPDPTPDPTPDPEPDPNPTPDPDPTPGPDPAPTPDPDTNQKVTEVFSDITENAWFVNAVQFVYDNNIMAGKGDDFAPNDPLTREQFTQVLYNHSGKPTVDTSDNPFPDVKNEWYIKSVLWARTNNIASGKGDGTFGVGENISREALAQMLYKYAQMNSYDMSVDEEAISSFADTASVSGWAKKAMNWAVTHGIMSGKGSGDDPSAYRLDPQGNATRAECASMMRKLLTMGQKKYECAILV